MHSIRLKYRTPKRCPTIISIMPPGVTPIVTFRGSNHRCLEQIFMVQRGSSHRSSTVSGIKFHLTPQLNPSLAKHAMPCLSKQCRSRSDLNFTEAVKWTRKISGLKPLLIRHACRFFRVNTECITHSKKKKKKKKNIGRENTQCTKFNLGLCLY